MINRNKIRGLLAERQMTQSQLADKIGISKNALNLKLLGKSTFNEREIKRIADVFEIRIDLLWT